MGRFLGSDSNSSQPTLFQRHHGDNSSFFFLLKFFSFNLFLAANFVFDSEAQQLGFFPGKVFFVVSLLIAPGHHLPGCDHHRGTPLGQTFESLERVVDEDPIFVPAMTTDQMTAGKS